LLAIAILESIYREVDDESTSQTPFHVKIEITHYDEMNNKIYDIDIDINTNVWDHARNVMKPISSH
jgi:hypothetical protein